MKLKRPTTKTYKRPLVIAVFSLGALVLLGFWAVQIYVMTQNTGFGAIAQTVEETQAHIQEGAAFADELQPMDAVPIPDILLQFQTAAENELQKELITQQAAAAMINELETNQEFDQTNTEYAEEE